MESAEAVNILQHKEVNLTIGLLEVFFIENTSWFVKSTIFIAPPYEEIANQLFKCFFFYLLGFKLNSIQRLKYETIYIRKPSPSKIWERGH
ncbi:MAG: hypothetical protein DRP64_01670 [Verrucomicrobia bacterium]|nr:MAG: hypothetical protein DRP64_01670 [Verrucomicrobiota bacterium]